MKIQLTRYYTDSNIVKGTLAIDSNPFCETREPGNRSGYGAHLPVGTYTCRCRPTMFSPMTLQVCRLRGQSMVHIGWSPVKQWLSGTICMGQPDSADTPEERELTRQQETFDAFTQRVYEAYVQGEPFTLEVREEV